MKKRRHKVKLQEQTGMRGWGRHTLFWEMWQLPEGWWGQATCWANSQFVLRRHRTEGEVCRRGSAAEVLLGGAPGRKDQYFCSLLLSVAAGF